VLEAMASGVPVVASRIGGVDEIIVDGQTGILFTPGDPRALSKALVTLIKDKQRAKEMGAAGKRLVMEKFQLKTTVQQINNLYYQLLHNRDHKHK
jgi:glycosyltransferase involved in cell wall biosynthesis